VIREYVEHYHRERNHQGLENAVIKELLANTDSRTTDMRTRERLGGLMEYCDSEVA
jgi:hypothetical protein